MPLSIWDLTMNCRLISWLLVACVAPASARDPFTPLQAPCLATATPLAGWQLQGMVGRDNHYRGWLRSTQGERIPVASDRPSPFIDWRIEAFTPFRLTLSSPQSCAPQRITLQIKGKYYDKDWHSAAAVERDRTGQ